VTAIDRQVLIDTIAELVRIPSINPDLVAGAGGERELAEAIATRLRRTPGIAVELQDAGLGRPNVIASVGGGPGRTLMLNGHVDTVGVAGMTDPFAGHVAGTKLYGRGSIDMKASMAVAIVLLESIARTGDFPGRLVVTFVVDEEYASIGTQAICREIDRWKPGAAIVLEPSDHYVTIAHKGFAWATIATRGFAAHGSAYAVGVDAIVHMGRVLVALEEYGVELLSRAPHDLVGPPSVHASLIHGGQELSSYPDACVLEIERRTIPGESEEQVRRELESILDRLTAADPNRFSATLTMGVFREPFQISPDADIVRCVTSAIRDELQREPQFDGAAGWMDSALLSAVGVPTVIFGPSGDGAHAVEEWCDLDSVEEFGRVLTRIVYEYCGQ
jgi:acetylornithine deacetylase